MSWTVSVQLQLGALELDVQLEGGSRPVALMGPNGSGKTTLLRTIAGAHRPHGGYIQVGDRLLFDAKRGIDLAPAERSIGYVPQGSGLFPHLSAVDNVAFGWLQRRPRPSRAQRRAAALDLMGRMGCAHLASRQPIGLSTGERQRVALARTLMTEPQLLLLDEPLSALDVSARRALRAYLAEHLRERSAPTLFVTHDLRDVRALGAELWVLEAGRITQKGSLEELSAAPTSEFVAELFDLGPV